MSHSRLRNEANCLNCDTEVIGRFCHVCGQENIEPRESFSGLIIHFFNDITHFDGKFFKTLGPLLYKPGFLPFEYMKGRRASYLHPIRMYLFTSALFFFIFYSYTGKIEVNEGRNIELVPVPAEGSFRDTFSLDAFSRQYPSVAAYDSIQNTLPEKEREGWIQRMIARRVIYMNSRYKDDVRGLVSDVLDGLLHSLPSLLFVSLPIFAMILKILYRRRDFVYADHAIHLVFLYIFMFILVLIYIGIERLGSVSWLSWLRYLLVPIILYGVAYSFLSMKGFYRQGWGKTLLKYFVFNFFALIVIIFLFIVFLLLTFFRV